MSSRNLHPVAARVSRSFRAAIVSTARRQGISVSALIKEAVQKHIGGVDAGVNTPPRSTAQTAPVPWIEPARIDRREPRILRHPTANDAAPASSIGTKAGGYFVERR